MVMIEFRMPKKLLSRFLGVSSTLRIHGKAQLTRQFHASPIFRTDGVYQDLTNMRVRTPWIEALRKQREDEGDPTQEPEKSAIPSCRNPEPKKMSDSFHRVVRARSGG